MHQLAHLLSQRKDHLLQFRPCPLPLLLHRQPFVQLALAGLLLLEFVRTFLGFSSVMTEKRIEEGDIDP